MHAERQSERRLHGRCSHAVEPDRDEPATCHMQALPLDGPQTLIGQPGGHGLCQVVVLEPETLSGLEDATMPMAMARPSLLSRVRIVPGLASG